MFRNSNSDGASLTTAIPTNSGEDIKSFIIYCEITVFSFLYCVCVCHLSFHGYEIFL